MQSKSIARELALLVLCQISENETTLLEPTPIENLLNKALEGLKQYWREGLDISAGKLECAHQNLLDSESIEIEKGSVEQIRNLLNSCLVDVENVLNSLSASLDFPQLLALSDQEEIRHEAMKRITLVLQQRLEIDQSLDDVMEGWRLKRLPRIDRDILRLAAIDLNYLETPPAVACNEAVDLANRYSDEQGRRMINGVLRRLQDSTKEAIST